MEGEVRVARPHIVLDIARLDIVFYVVCLEKSYRLLRIPCPAVSVSHNGGSQNPMSAGTPSSESAPTTGGNSPCAYS